MKVVIDRGLCNTNLTHCQRCSAALIRHPEGYDRPCILDIIEDARETLTIELRTDGRQIQLELNEQDQELAAVEGWEALADFEHKKAAYGSNFEKVLAQFRRKLDTRCRRAE